MAVRTPVHLPVAFLHRHRGALEAALRIAQLFGLLHEPLGGEHFFGDVARGAERAQRPTLGVAKEALVKLQVPDRAIGGGAAHAAGQVLRALFQRLQGGEAHRFGVLWNNGQHQHPMRNLDVHRSGIGAVRQLTDPGEPLGDVREFPAREPRGLRGYTESFEQLVLDAGVRRWCWYVIFARHSGWSPRGSVPTVAAGCRPLSGTPSQVEGVLFSKRRGHGYVAVRARRNCAPGHAE